MLSPVANAFLAEERLGRFKRLIPTVPVASGLAALRDNRCPRPFFIDQLLAEHVAADVVTVLRGIVELPIRLFGGDVYAFGAACGYTPSQVKLALRTQGNYHATYGRADLYNDGSLRLLELNASSAIGGVQFAELNRALLHVDSFSSFASEHRLGYVDTVARIAVALRRYLGNSGSQSRVAIVDWPTAYTQSERNLRVLALLLSAQGFEVEVGHVGELVSTRRGLQLNGLPIDLVYRFFGLGEIFADASGPELIEPVVRAHEDGKTLLFLPLTYSLYSSKNALGLLSSRQCDPPYDPTTLAAFDRLLPWSRVLHEGIVDFDGSSMPMLDFCRKHRHELIIKPAAGYRGIGVVTGWTVDAAQWDAALARGLEKSSLVQRRVRNVPVLVNDASGQPNEYALNWGMFVIDDSYGGARVLGIPAVGADVISVGGAQAGCVFHQIASDPGLV